METTGYEYDAQNRPIAVHTFSSVATNGISHFYRYDARGRRSDYKVELEAEPAGSQRTIAQYGYDANGNLTSLKLGLNVPGDTTVRTEFVYDGRNRLTRKQSFNKFGTRVSECVYSYFANSNIATRGEFHLPMQGEASSWEATFRHSYDGANRLTGQWQEVSEPLDTMVLYEPIAPEVRAKHRLRLKAGFDTRTVTGTGASGTGVKFRGRIGANAYTPPLVLAEGYLAMDYDDFGRIRRLLRYDGKGRAIDSLTYQYLNNTGRLGHVRDGVGSEVSGNDVDNQMPNNYAYDASGNMTQDLGSGIGEIRYNPYNLPTTLIKSGQTYQYRYDGAGKRIEKIQPNGTFEAYRRGANNEIFGIYNTNGNAITLYTDELGEMRYENSNWVGYFFVTDATGNVRMLMKSDGTIVRTNDYDAIGYEYEPIHRPNALDNKRLWLSREQDLESGFYNLGVRPYDARQGMFLKPEPLYNQFLSINPYSYGRNNALRFIDPSGFAPQEKNAPKDRALRSVKLTLGIAIGLKAEFKNPIVGLKLGAETSTKIDVNLKGEQITYKENSIQGAITLGKTGAIGYGTKEKVPIETNINQTISAETEKILTGSREISSGFGEFKAENFELGFEVSTMGLSAGGSVDFEKLGSAIVEGIKLIPAELNRIVNQAESTLLGK